MRKTIATRFLAMALAAVTAISYMPATTVYADEAVSSVTGTLEGSTDATASDTDVSLDLAAVSDTEVAAEGFHVNADTIDIYYIPDSYGNNVTLPDTYKSSYQIETGGAAGDVTYKVTNGYAAKVSDTGLIEPYYWLNESTQRKTYYAGTAKIKVSDGTNFKVITVNVHDYSTIYVKEVEESFVRENITDDMTDYDKLKAITEYVAHTYNYSAGYSSATDMIMSGGGDCWASCGLIRDLCTLVGLESYIRVANQDPLAGSGHRNVIVRCAEKIYIADAGYSGSAPRYYALRESDGFSISGTTLYQYDGFDAEITVPSGVTRVGYTGENVFYYAPKRDTITSITLPASVSDMSYYAFSGLSNLETLSVDSDNTTYKSKDGVIYSKDGQTLITVPNGKSFVSIPEDVTTIGEYSFYYNSKITEVTIPANVIKIAEGAFGTCSNLSSVVVPASVTSIGDYAFYSGVKKLVVLSKNAVFGSKVFGGSYSVSGYTIVGYSGSTAEAYANENNITFIALDSDGYYVGEADGKTCVLTELGAIADVTGFRTVNGKNIYFEHGVMSTATGLVDFGGIYYYIVDGSLSETEAIVSKDGTLFYVKDGIWQSGFTGTKQISGKGYNIQNGIATVKIDETSKEDATDTVIYYYIDPDNGSFDGTYYTLNGKVIKNAFFCDGEYTYYLQVNGTPMKNMLTYHPDGKHIIYFDANGHEVFSNFAEVKKSIEGKPVDDLCFFDVNGYMYVNKLTYNQEGTKLYYVNEYGVIERNGWFKFPDIIEGLTTGVYEHVSSSGYGNLYGYGQSDGSLLTNTWTFNWNNQMVYLQGNGTAVKGLFYIDGFWRLFDANDGHLLQSTAVRPASYSLTEYFADGSSQTKTYN